MQHPNALPKRCQSCGWTLPAPQPLAGAPCPTCHLPWLTGKKPPGFVAQFFSGLSYPFRGLSMLLRHPSLIPHAVVPLLVNIVLLAALTVVFLTHGRALLEFTPAWSAWNWPLLCLYYPLYGVAWSIYGLIDNAWLAWLGYLLWFALQGVLFVFLGPLLTWPLSEKLAARTEVLVLGKALQAPRDALPWWRSALLGGLEIFVVLLFSLGSLALHFIPLVGSLAYFLVASWWLSYDFLCFGAVPRAYGLTEKISLLNAHLGKVIGFGVISGFLISLPLLNLVFLPIAIVGAVIMYLELEQK